MDPASSYSSILLKRLANGIEAGLQRSEQLLTSPRLHFGERGLLFDESPGHGAIEHAARLEIGAQPEFVQRPLRFFESLSEYTLVRSGHRLDQCEFHQRRIGLTDRVGRTDARGFDRARESIPENLLLLRFVVVPRVGEIGEREEAVGREG